MGPGGRKQGIRGEAQSRGPCRRAAQNHEFAVFPDIGREDRGTFIGGQRPDQRGREFSHVASAPDNVP